MENPGSDVFQCLDTSQVYACRSVAVQVTRWRETAWLSVPFDAHGLLESPLDPR